MGPEFLTVRGQGLYQKTSPSQLLKMERLGIGDRVIGSHIHKKALRLAFEELADQALFELRSDLRPINGSAFEVRIDTQISVLAVSHKKARLPN